MSAQPVDPVLGPPVASTDAPEQLLQNIVSLEADLKSELRRRRDRNIYKSVHPADVETEAAAGWVVHKIGKTSVRLSKPKTHDVWLEDRAWCLLRLMRYPEMNGHRFRIDYKRRDGTTDSKQIDVYAKDDETVLVIECKSRLTRGRRSLTKDLTETQSLQAPIRDAIRRIYGRDSKLQAIFIYVTENVIWSEPDLERAHAINVRVITENEMRYYSRFVHHLGPAGKYQFLAELQQGRKVSGLEGVKVPAVRGKFGKNTFYSFVIPARHLLKIAFVNHQALNHPDGTPAYQRMISPSRLKEIGLFIENGGFFPTNILINFVGGCTFDLLPKEFNTSDTLKFGMLHLPATYRSAWVIDGQHRLYGYSKISEKKLDQSLFVLAFDRMETIQEAELFITINNKQKSVPPAILASLKADLNWESTDPRERIEALASALVKVINTDATSPFFQRFAMEGLEGAEEAAVTIGEVSKGLVRAGLLGRTVQKSYSLGPLSAATDSDTIKRARRVLNGYFNPLRATNEARWEVGKSGYVLSNPGVRAHLMLVAEILKYLASERNLEPDLLSETELLREIALVAEPVFDYFKSAPDVDVQTKFARRFGEGGVRDYFFTLASMIQKLRPSFGGEELRTWLAETDQIRKETAHIEVIKVNELIVDFVFDTLKRVHGTHEIAGSGEKAYWEIGVESAKTKEEAYKKQQQAPLAERKAREVYVDMIELKGIVRQKNNWEYFKDVFNLPLDGEKGKVYFLDWMDEFNKIRRIPAHSSSQRAYTEDDYAFLDWISRNFLPKLEAAKGKSAPR
jgi:DNA sulfur modification protein DndB